MQTEVKQPSLIFGYGSLLQEESLKATVPSAKNIRPVYIKGFRRVFTLWDPVGWTETNLDLKDIPFCGVDAVPTSDKNATVNGVVFEVSADELPALLEREKEYDLIEVAAYDFSTDEPVGTCLVFSSGKETGAYDFDSEAQKRYLDVCTEGAASFGEDFLQQFLVTTYINDVSLKNIESLH